MRCTSLPITHRQTMLVTQLTSAPTRKGPFWLQGGGNGNQLMNALVLINGFMIHAIFLEKYEPTSAKHVQTEYETKHIASDK